MCREANETCQREQEYDDNCSRFLHSEEFRRAFHLRRRSSEISLRKILAKSIEKGVYDFLFDVLAPGALN